MFTAIYMILGGYKSMAMIDTVFGVIMVAGVGVLLFCTINAGGGLAKMTADLAAIDPRLAGPIGPPGWWPLFCLVFLTSVAPFGMPQLLQKFYAIKDARSGPDRHGRIDGLRDPDRRGGLLHGGATTRLFLSPESSPKIFQDGRPLVDRLMPELARQRHPRGSVGSDAAAGAVGVDVHAGGAGFAVQLGWSQRDFYAGFVNRQASDARLTMLMRVLSAAFIIVSVVLAALELETIVAILAISWGAIGSVFSRTIRVGDSQSTGYSLRGRRVGRAGAGHVVWRSLSRVARGPRRGRWG